MKVIAVSSTDVETRGETDIMAMISMKGIKDWAWSDQQPGEKSAPLVAWAKKTVRVLLITAYGFERNQLSLRASALTYTVILSLIPLLAMSTAVLKGLGADDQMKSMVYRMLEQLAEQTGSQGFSTPDGQDVSRGEPKETVSSATASSEVDAQSAASDRPKELESSEKGGGPEGPEPEASLQEMDSGSSGEMASAALAPGGEVQAESQDREGMDRARKGSIQHLRLAVDKIFDYVDRTNFAALGWFGILGVVYTVIMLMSHIEEALNAIWATEEARDIGRKVIDYLALIILLPLSINVAFWGMAALQNERFIARVAGFFKVGWALPLIFKLLPALLVVGTFAILYRFMPNTKVKVFPATVGGFIGGIGWILMQAIYVKLQIGVARYNAIYGSFATFPLFIFWLYLSWVIFLIGAQASYAIQNHNAISLLVKRWRPALYLALGLDVMLELFRGLDRGEAMGRCQIAARIGGPMDKVQETVELLKKAGLVAETREGERFLPAISRQAYRRSAVFTAIMGSLGDGPRSEGRILAAKALEAATSALDGEGERDAWQKAEDGTRSG